MLNETKIIGCPRWMEQDVTSNETNFKKVKCANI